MFRVTDWYTCYLIPKVWRYHLLQNTFKHLCSNYTKPISATQCFVETNDIVIDPISERFNDNISPSNSKACLICSSFVNDQSFESNLTGRINKTQTYEQLTFGPSNVVYGIHCIRCGLMYVGETGRSLWSRINGHLAGIKLKLVKVCSTNAFIYLDIQLLTWGFTYLKRYTIPQKVL